jgi:galactokinase
LSGTHQQSSAALRERASTAFRGHFGAPPALIACAPGRVNLIGEHTDYNEGFVLPCAIGRYTLIAARRRPDMRIDAVAEDLAAARASFDLGAPIHTDSHQPWSNYVRGMAALMQAAGYALPGAELLIAGDLPRGAGLSSSASLELATGLALAALAGRPTPDLTQLARLAQRTEQEFAGLPCGVMDPLVSARNLAGHALLIDCRSLETRPIPLPRGAAVMIVHSGITRELAGGAYAQRRAQCDAVAAQLGVRALRDIDLPVLLGARARIEPVAWRRAHHIVTENARTLEAAACLERGDLAQLGRAMAASHASMRDDFEITLPAIDRLASLMQRAIGGRGGARMTGGGFGGAVVAVLSADAVPEVTAAVRAGYRTPAGLPPEILIEQPVSGAHLLG